jgi:hypothetical protein
VQHGERTPLAIRRCQWLLQQQRRLPPLLLLLRADC